MNQKNWTRVAGLLMLLNFASCQRTWVASPTLETTDAPVAEYIPADPQLDKQIEPYRKEVTAKMSEVLGTAPDAIGVAAYESPLGKFVVDLQFAQTEPTYGKQIDMSLTTNGGLRVPLPKGDITTGNVFELMPFDNELVVLTLKGTVVKQLFDYAAETKFASIGNTTYTVKGGKPTDIKIGGKPFDPDQTYTLVTSDYLAGGGDDLKMLKNVVKYEKTGILLRDAIMMQIKQMTAAGIPITPDTKKRVTVLP